VESGRTGFIVREIDEAVEAVNRLRDLRRTEVRRRFEARFSALAMARHYLHLYAAISGCDQYQQKAFA
jgi:glycosyltransferase involved in cell wall biosynthesis